MAVRLPNGEQTPRENAMTSCSTKPATELQSLQCRRCTLAEKKTLHAQNEACRTGARPVTRQDKRSDRPTRFTGDLRQAVLAKKLSQQSVFTRGRHTRPVRARQADRSTAKVLAINL